MDRIVTQHALRLGREAVQEIVGDSITDWRWVDFALYAMTCRYKGREYRVSLSLRPTLNNNTCARMDFARVVNGRKVALFPSTSFLLDSSLNAHVCAGWHPSRYTTDFKWTVNLLEDEILRNIRGD